MLSLEEGQSGGWRRLQLSLNSHTCVLAQYLGHPCEGGEWRHGEEALAEYFGAVFTKTH